MLGTAGNDITGRAEPSDLNRAFQRLRQICENRGVTLRVQTFVPPRFLPTRIDSVKVLRRWAWTRDGRGRKVWGKLVELRQSRGDDWGSSVRREIWTCGNGWQSSANSSW